MNSVLDIRSQIFQKWNQTVRHFRLISYINTLFLDSCESHNTSSTFDNDVVQSDSSDGGKLFQLTYKCDNIVVYVYGRYLYINSKRKQSIK